MSDLGKRIAYIREIHHMSQRQLMNKLNITNLGRIEKGERKPGIEIIIALSNYFNISTDWILKNKGQTPTVNNAEDEKKDNISDTELQYFGKSLRKIRILNNITIVNLSLKTSIDYNKLEHFESGDYLPLPNELISIITSFECFSIENLFKQETLNNLSKYLNFNLKKLKNISKKIINLLKDNNISLKILSMLTGISQNTINNWISNKSIPDIISIYKISKIFNISLDSFIDENTNKKENHNNDIVLNQLSNEEKNIISCFRSVSKTDQFIIKNMIEKFQPEVKGGESFPSEENNIN